jgi:hypothetical protein
MITAPILQIFWSHRVSFLVVMCLTFIAFAAVIFTLPARVTVRSSIEIGSTAVGNRPEAFEPPENIAKQIPSVYGPAALLAMASKGTSSLILSAIQNPSVESTGRSVVMVSTIDPSIETEAKEFQETIADHIIKELAPRAQALRESIATRIALATQASNSLEQQINEDANKIERIGALADELHSQLAKQRETLTALYQRTGTALQPGESAIVEAHIRELHEQISSQTRLMGDLTLERSDITRDLAMTRRLREAQGEAVANAQFEKNSFNETHITLPPSLMPARTTSRQISLLLVAFATSLLAGFGTVVLLHNFGARIF